MHQLIWAMCWLIFGTGLVLAAGRPSKPRSNCKGHGLQQRAESNGKAADDVVGYRLSFTGNRFQIQSKDGKPLYAGTVRVDPSAKPAAIETATG